jgi:hypothetical protein
MADIIGSSEKTPGPLMIHFKQMIEKVNKEYKDHLMSPLTITLGDEFQGVVDSLEQGLDIIWRLDTLNLTSDESYRLRFILLYGEIDTPLNKEVAYGMLGSGLTEAREQLEKLKKSGREIGILGIDEKKAEKLMLAFDLYRSLYNDWPDKDRQVAYDFLMIKDYKKVASLHDRDTSSMWRKERSLKMREYATSKTLIRLLAYE